MSAVALSPLTVLARRKWVVIGTFVAIVISAAIVSKSLDKVYSTSSTLLVALRSDNQTFDTVQASQAIARSYADIIDSPNIAGRVATRVGAATTTREIKDATSFEAIPQTQLLKIQAEAPTPERAKRIADEYADVFIAYAAANLETTTHASITLADRAPLVGSASRPRPTLYTAVAGLLGLAFAIGLAFLLETLDRRLRTAEDVESHFDVPVIARVPRRGRSERSVAGFTEALRILRTNLQFSRVDAPLRSIAITSALEGEGKTTIAANLAVTIAEVGRQVIVVEADLRRPALQRELVDTDDPLVLGLSNYLVASSTLEQSIYPTGRPGVRLMPAGPLPPSPSALLESERARGAFATLAEEGDLVIYDCPPLNIGADASIVADRVDGVILVVDLQTATTSALQQALRQLETIKASLLGLVINRDRDAAPRAYDYYAPLPARVGDREKERV
jgi:capsular exopolysaccharide synthesis family protein